MNVTLLDIDRDEKLIFQLYKELPDSSFFTSSAWLSNLLFALSDHKRLFVVKVTDGKRIVAVFLAGFKNDVFSWLIKRKSVVVNETGISRVDRALWIEYNDPFSLLKSDKDFYEFFETMPSRWDEICISCVPEEASLTKYVCSHFSENDAKSKFEVKTTKKSKCYYVDLEKVRSADNQIISLLSKNTRYQVKRSYKEFGKHGKIQLNVASTVDEALLFFNELYGMHESIWYEKKLKSNFINSFSYKFHNELIKNRFEQQQVQLIKVIFDEQIIGLLYNFVHERSVLFFQSAIPTNKSNNLKPGYISHIEAINYNASIGMRYYNFLVGNETYKKSLSTDFTSMYWFKFIRPNVRTKAERIIKAIYHFNFKKN